MKVLLGVRKVLLGVRRVLQKNANKKVLLLAWVAALLTF